MKMSRCLSMIRPWAWMNVCNVYSLTLWSRIWGGLYCCSSSYKKGCVSGCVSYQSVAPCRGEQPLIRTPRCCLLWLFWSMMGSAMSETFCYDLPFLLQCFGFSFEEVVGFITTIVLSTHLFNQFGVDFLKFYTLSQSYLGDDFERLQISASFHDEDLVYFFVIGAGELWKKYCR